MFSYFKRQGYLFGKKGDFYIQLIIKNGHLASVAHELEHWPSHQRVLSSISDQEGEGTCPILLVPIAQQHLVTLAGVTLPAAAAGFSFQFFQHLQNHDHLLKDPCTSQLSPSTDIWVFQGPAMCTHSPSMGREGESGAWCHSPAPQHSPSKPLVFVHVSLLGSCDNWILFCLPN